MNRAKTISRINELLSRFVAEVKIANENNLYDLNIHAENVIIPLLNRLYGLVLENANKKRKNYPSVDLVDEINKVAFQVTSTANNEKIKHTLVEFNKHKLYEKFDFLYLYILTEKQKSYSGKGFDEIIEERFSFNKDKNIIDYSDVIKKIEEILNLSVLIGIQELLESEFSEAKIAERRHLLEHPKEEDIEVEYIFPNLLEIEIPEKIYVAEIGFDRREIIEQSRKTKRKLWWKSSQRKVASRVLNDSGNEYYHDWHLYENNLITFKNLFDSNEPLRCLIDEGTINGFDAKDYYEINDDYKRAFKSLLGYCLREKLSLKEVEWVHEEKLYRFKTNREVPRAKQVRWRKENQSKKTVISEIYSKSEGHIICFKHLAFHYSIYDFDDTWYLSISPTWSFSSNGWKKSRFSKNYKSGIKRLEGNKSVYYYFRFWAYFLNYYDLFDQPYDFFKTKKAFSFPFSPIVEDNNWKSKTSIREIDESLDDLIDEELTKSLFD